MRGRLIVVAAVMLAAGANAASGIPAFARKYGVSCSMCHSPVPRLNAFGETFAGNGFEFYPGEPARDTMNVNDELLRLQRLFPLAVRVDGYVQGYTKSPQDATKFDLQTPWAIKLLSGGQIADRISYYLYFFMSERGEVAGLEDAYLQFTDIASTGISVIAGQFQVSDPLYKRELRLEYEDYQVYRVRVGDVRADLTYDRGAMALYSPRDGTDIVVQVLNGRGLSAADETKHYDRDAFKTYSLRLTQDVGRLRIGAFGYYGEESLDGHQDRIRIWGPDVTLAVGQNLEINAQWLRREDTQPFFGTTLPGKTYVDGGLLELVWAPAGPIGRWHVTGLYNHVESDEALFTIRQGEAGPLDTYRSASLGASYLLARNLRLLGEWQYDLESENNRLTMGLVTAF
jgi:hypothetical protein